MTDIHQNDHKYFKTNLQTIRCNFCILAPPINCKWSPFGEWTGCTATCGAGLKQRSRTVLQEAINDGRDCVGCRVEIEICNVQECPLKGKLCNLFNRRSLLNHFPEDNAEVNFLTYSGSIWNVDIMGAVDTMHRSMRYW